jgi:hypothetical protein
MPRHNDSQSRRRRSRIRTGTLDSRGRPLAELAEDARDSARRRRHRKPSEAEVPLSDRDPSLA